MSSREIEERMDQQARRSLRGLRMFYTKETHALCSMPHCGSSWMGVLEYGERFAVDLDRYGRTISPTSRDGKKNSGIANSKRAVKNYMEMRSWQR